MTLDFVLKESTESHDKCEAEKVCRAESVKLGEAHRLQVAVAYDSDTCDELHRPDPLWRLWTWLLDEDLCGDLCSVCAETLRLRISHKMYEIWGDLPHMFHIDSLKLGQCSMNCLAFDCANSLFVFLRRNALKTVDTMYAHIAFVCCVRRYIVYR